MRNEEYWRKRFELLEVLLLNKGVDYYNELSKHYTKAVEEISKEIEAWYQRYAQDEGISILEAKKRLNNKELKAFKMDIEEYIEKGKTLNYHNTWRRELEHMSAKWHISRLEHLNFEIQQQIEELYTYENDALNEVLSDIYTEGYFRTAFEIQKGLGVAWELAGLDENKVSKVIAAPWTVDGLNFSERIWGKHRPELVSFLKEELTQTIIRGESPRTLIDKVSKKFSTSRNNAASLVMTESAFFSSASRKDCFNTLDVEKYQIVATLDMKTSEKCRSLDGKIVDMRDYAVGETAPPFHVRCRTTTAPYFKDEFTVNNMRSARGPDSKTYEVPASMTYYEWKKAFVDGGSKPLKLNTNGGITEREEGALLKYVSSDSYIINDLLRRGEAIPTQYAETINALDSALTKLPRYKGNLVRDISFEDFSDKEERVKDFLSTFRVGGDRTFKEYISATKFNLYSENPSIRIYIQNATSGRDLGKYNQSEAEVLYERDSTFTVLNIMEYGGVYYILLGEKI